jgi:uncharacterized protein involved in type VI secretion and phage assembly
VIDPKAPFPAAGRQRLFGLYPAVVTDVQDPDSQGRVKVRLPWVDDAEGANATAWARLATMMAGGSRGTWFVPEVDDEVVVGFVAGDPRWPVVMGALWNGSDTPPETMNSNNDLRSITSRSGHVLRFDDTSGATKVEVLTAGGHTLRLDDASGGTITIQHQNGASVEIDASGKITITALSQVSVSAPMVNVDSPMSKFSGVVKAETVITNAVISSSYTPGAGNVW